MRIVAGEHKGRRLLPPKGCRTRPMTDRVKTALFDVLAGAADAAAVVDLFCGTGSLGLEALSRGAASCCFAERDPAAVDRLRRNVEAMGLADRCTVWRGDVMRHLRRWLATLADPIDLAFVDPPYALTERWRPGEAGERIFAPLADRLADDGLVVFRCRRNTPVGDALAPLCVRQRRDYGTMSLLFLGGP